MLVAFDPYIRFSVYEGRILDPSRATVDPAGLRLVDRGELRAAGTERLAVPGVGDLTLSFPELRQYSELLISRDVGIPLVLAAAILVLVGLLPALFVSRRKIWARAEPTDGGSLVTVAGFALQRKDAFEEEFSGLVRALGAAASSSRPAERVGTP
jgi:cytochrome c biogenesis protein ResB